MSYKGLITAFVILLLSSPAYAYNKTPGKGITITPARATWNTGHFHETIIRKGLKELGYTVKKPVELSVPLFSKAAQLGDVDYWPNAWFPLYDSFLAKNDKLVKVGYIVKGEALQGYLIDKKHAELLNIKSLNDFRRPEVRKAFDRNGNGKADLTSSPHGWQVGPVVKDHIKRYELTEYIEPINAAYIAAMAANIAALKNGEPIFYYTWTPSWTVFELRPGKEVVWINVPFNYAPEGSDQKPENMKVYDVEGAVTNPIDMGFSVADIRFCANEDFIKQNPPVKLFFELFKINIEDLNAQYAKLHAGEKSPADIERHANEWIEINRELWDSWLEQVRSSVN